MIARKCCLNALSGTKKGLSRLAGDALIKLITSEKFSALTKSLMSRSFWATLYMWRLCCELSLIRVEDQANASKTYSG